MSASSIRGAAGLPRAALAATCRTLGLPTTGRHADLVARLAERRGFTGPGSGCGTTR